jgi:hypothetical protein
MTKPRRVPGPPRRCYRWAEMMTYAQCSAFSDASQLVREVVLPVRVAPKLMPTKSRRKKN